MSVIKVTVKFDGIVPSPIQGIALLEFERHLRRLTGFDRRVYKELKGDGSKPKGKKAQVQRG